MSEAKNFLTLELRCACCSFGGSGSMLFIEVPVEPPRFSNLPEKLVELATAWTKAHAAHHQEPKK
jgi:hypothetical protein